MVTYFLKWNNSPDTKLPSQLYTSSKPFLDGIYKQESTKSINNNNNETVIDRNIWYKEHLHFQN